MSATFAQSVLLCVGDNSGTNSSKTIESESALVSLGSSNSPDDFDNWKVISGTWKHSSSSLEGGAGPNTTNAVENIIINPTGSENISDINTTFKMTETDPNFSSYAYIVYSYLNPDNFKIAGIQVENDDIFVRFAEIANGCLTTAPSYIYTGIQWQPNSTFDLALTSEDGIQGLKLNGTQFAGKNDTNIDGITGLLYGRISDIEFYNFTVNHPFITGDSQTIMLGEKSLPSDDFIHVYDSSPYKVIEGHISAKLPCDENYNTELQVLTGQINPEQVVSLESVPEQSDPGNLCQYNSDFGSTKDTSITDIVVLNNSTEDIEFPETSSLVVTVSKIAELQ